MGFDDKKGRARLMALPLFLGLAQKQLRMLSRLLHRRKSTSVLAKVNVLPQSQFQNVPFWPISALGSNFNPQNTQCIPVVKIFARLDLDQTATF